MKFIILLSFFPLLKCWSPNSWRQKPVKQIPKYPDIIELENVENQLKKKAPIIFAG